MEDLSKEQEQEQQPFDQHKQGKRQGTNLPTRAKQYSAITSASFKRSWPVWLVSLVMFLNGAWSIASILLTRVPQRVQNILPFGGFHWTRSLTLVIGFILVYLSFQLFQRRRVAWWVAVFAVGLEFIAHIIHLRTSFTAFPEVITFVLLIVFQGRFNVRSESRNIRLGFLLLLGSLFIALLYGTIGFWMLDKRDFGITFSLQDGLVRSLRQFLSTRKFGPCSVKSTGRWFLQSLGYYRYCSRMFAIYSLFRPIVYRLVQLPHERARAMAILRNMVSPHSTILRFGRTNHYSFHPAMNLSSLIGW